MVIELSRPAPPVTQLMDLLKREFSNKYSYQLYGVKQDSILIGKSFFYGAQISVQNKQISIQYSPPSWLAGFISSLAMTELGVFIIPFIFFSGIPTQSGINIFLKGIARFLNKKLN